MLIDESPRSPSVTSRRKTERWPGEKETGRGHAGRDGATKRSAMEMIDPEAEDTARNKRSETGRSSRRVERWCFVFLQRSVKRCFCDMQHLPTCGRAPGCVFPPASARRMKRAFFFLSLFPRRSGIHFSWFLIFSERSYILCERGSQHSYSESAHFGL